MQIAMLPVSLMHMVGRRPWYAKLVCSIACMTTARQAIWRWACACCCPCQA